MSDKQNSSCIELSEIRKLDQLLTQCETSSCEHICRDCCAKLGSLEDITDHQDDDYDPEHHQSDSEEDEEEDDPPRVKEAELVDCERDREESGGDKMLVRLASDSGENEALNLSEEVERFCREGNELPLKRLCRNETVTDGSTQCMEPLTCDRRLNHVTVNKATLWICENCERRNRRSDQQRRHHGGHKKHSLTINEKPTKLLRLQHKCSSENCLKNQPRAAIGQPQQNQSTSSSLRQQKALAPSSETISGGKTVSMSHKPKSSPQMMGRRISCRIPDDLEPGAREALLGSRFGSLHEKKLPEPVETVC